MPGLLPAPGAIPSSRLYSRGYFFLPGLLPGLFPAPGAIPISRGYSRLDRSLPCRGCSHLPGLFPGLFPAAEAGAVSELFPAVVAPYSMHSHPIPCNPVPSRTTTPSAPRLSPFTAGSGPARRLPHPKFRGEEEKEEEEDDGGAEAAEAAPGPPRFSGLVPPPFPSRSRSRCPSPAVPLPFPLPLTSRLSRSPRTPPRPFEGVGGGRRPGKGWEEAGKERSRRPGRGREGAPGPRCPRGARPRYGGIPGGFPEGFPLLRPPRAFGGIPGTERFSDGFSLHPWSPARVFPGNRRVGKSRSAGGAATSPAVPPPGSGVWGHERNPGRRGGFGRAQCPRKSGTGTCGSWLEKELVWGVGSGDRGDRELFWRSRVGHLF